MVSAPRSGVQNHGNSSVGGTPAVVAPRHTVPAPALSYIVAHRRHEMKCATSASATITRASAIMPVMTSLLPCLLSRSVEEARPADFKPCLRSITAALERAVSPTAQAPPRPAFGLRARIFFTRPLES